MIAVALAVAEEVVFALAPVHLVEGAQALGGRLAVLGEGGEAGDLCGVGCGIVLHPLGVGIEGVDVILRVA
jgi:hypothetical protein